MNEWFWLTLGALFAACAFLALLHVDRYMP
jgi:hypothetical protein